MNCRRVAAVASTLAVVSVGALWPAQPTHRPKLRPRWCRPPTPFSSLTPQQRAKAVLSFDDQERFVWQEAPGVRSGVVLRARRAAEATGHGASAIGHGRGGLPANPDEHGSRTVLSALQKAPKVRLFVILRFSTSRFSEPLRQRLRGDGPSRDTISPHFTIAAAQVAAAPMFLGSQPNDRRRLVSRARRRLRRQRFRPRWRVGSWDRKRTRHVRWCRHSTQSSVQLPCSIGPRSVMPTCSPVSTRGASHRFLHRTRRATMNAQQKAMLVALVDEYLTHTG